MAFTCGFSFFLFVFTKFSNPLLSIGRWEFAMNLTYEWSIIRRHRPYQPTIWVRDQLPFLSVSCSHRLNLLCQILIGLLCRAPVLPLGRNP